MAKEDYERAAKFRWVKDIPMNPGDMLVVTYEGAKYVTYMLAYSADRIDLDKVPGVLCIPAHKRQELHETITRRTARNGGSRQRSGMDPPRKLGTDTSGN